MRRGVWLLYNAIQKAPDAIKVKKDYQKIEADKKELAEIVNKKKEFENYPLRYQILECRPGLPLALTKLKYLLACRRTHPEAGGDAEDFLRVSLAYQDVMKDYGIETVDNKIVNLGNFQVDSHDAQNYLTARAEIESYIPISTLEDHIKQIEEIKNRLGDKLSDLLSSQNDEAMWLLEDIEEKMEEYGLNTVKLQVLEDGKVKVTDNLSLTDGTERPLFLADDANEGEQKETHQYQQEEQQTSQQPHGESNDQSTQKTEASHSESAQNSETMEKSIFEASVSSADIQTLNAKNTLQDRPDVAGLAARTATEVMNNTDEKRQIKMESSVLLVIASCIAVVIYTYIETRARGKRQQEKNPQTAEHIQSDTMLPWWGNDAEYESQVKRIFVEEWRRARASSQRTRVFQEGVTRESMDDEEKRKMDLQIFTVTAEKLREMREHAEKHPGRQ
ncbi:hypothetical protein STCU_04168 [Strigomonas culicis]|uniref:J domain-containing protein n=1 Tax=Strigomonas culicis TaxID=28005 RepID=S9W326_9TRYP|nr:hypothetical protein STCU_08418 [Strigomonas culicis]EPY30235.1 hypothetical protein STCU_04168 [Strigomonas culicis]|eukprot:EPY21960.1 hypothetical protein STCU_08418 [Strigomonas culicis]